MIVGRTVFLIIYGDIVVLKDYDLDIEKNSFTVLAGESGSGKSSLLNILGLLETFNSGEIFWWDYKNVKPYSALAQRILREKIGYLFQNFALVEDKSAKYNLNIALHNVQENKSSKKEMMIDALDKVGLSGFLDKKIYKCSGGEQQRIALARLLIKPCEIVLADEPTGSLDYKNKLIVLDILKEMQSKGKTLVIATHDKDIIDMADNVIMLEKYERNNQV